MDGIPTQPWQERACWYLNSVGEAPKYCARTIQTWESTILFTEILESAKESLTLDISPEVAGNGEWGGEWTGDWGMGRDTWEPLGVVGRGLACWVETEINWHTSEHSLCVIHTSLMTKAMNISQTVEASNDPSLSPFSFLPPQRNSTPRSVKLNACLQNFTIPVRMVNNS